jgi:hypothetical protein
MYDEVYHHPNQNFNFFEFFLIDLYVEKKIKIKKVVK